MNPRVRLALAGPGAFGQRHLEALRRIETAQVVSLVGPEPLRTAEIARRHGIAQVATTLDEVLARPDIDAAILCTPTPLHASQALACLRAGKHVQVEIPLAESLADARAVAEAQRATGRVAMCGHTRRFNPGHRWIHERMRAGTYRLQHLVAQTHFLRRSNLNLLGEPRSWTDHLLWHHAAHTVDLFLHQTTGPIRAAQALQGPRHATLGIALDMSVQLASADGALCTLSLSFNDAGPPGTTFRYIGDRGTYVARYDELHDGDGQPVATTDDDACRDGVELQDREFVAAILEGRAPRASVAEVLPCYELLDALARQLDG